MIVGGATPLELLARFFAFDPEVPRTTQRKRVHSRAYHYKRDVCLRSGFSKHDACKVAQQFAEHMMAKYDHDSEFEKID